MVGVFRSMYVQGFSFKAVTFKQAINFFEIMEFCKNIHTGAVEPSQKVTSKE